MQFGEYFVTVTNSKFIALVDLHLFRPTVFTVLRDTNLYISFHMCIS